MKYFDLLGYVCEDIVTGAKGVAESLSFDLYGCIQIAIRPQLPKDAKVDDYPDGRWFDAKRLKKISKKPVMEVPDFDLPECGPAEKPPATSLPPQS